MPRCAKKSRTDCTGPACRWASGKKRSFCRSKQNMTHVGDGVYVKTRSLTKPKRPKSACSKQPRTACTGPACRWASGKKRSFCRRASNTKRG